VIGAVEGDRQSTGGDRRETAAIDEGGKSFFPSFSFYSPAVMSEQLGRLDRHK